MRRTPLLSIVLLTSLVAPAGARPEAPDSPPPAVDLRLYELVDATSADRLEANIRRLVGFGTRHTMSETESQTRGIGAARRWIKAEFDNISEQCQGCLEVSFQRYLQKADPETRIGSDVEIVNVLGIIRGTVHKAG